MELFYIFEDWLQQGVFAYFFFPGSHSISPHPPYTVLTFTVSKLRRRKKKSRDLLASAVHMCLCTADLVISPLTWFLAFSRWWSCTLPWITRLECLRRRWRLSVASPTRLRAFKLNMHHISGNFDLPTFPFISSERGSVVATAACSGFVLVCALNWPLNDSSTYMSVTWQADWGEFIQLYCFDLHWFHHDAPPTLTHLYRVEWWWAVTPCCERKAIFRPFVVSACMYALGGGDSV